MSAKPIRFWLVWVLLGAPLPAGAQQTGGDASDLALGLALEQPAVPEERGGHDLPAALGKALEQLGVGRVVLADSQGLAGPGIPDPGRIRQLATESGVSALVVGRVTRLGGRLSVDVRLRSGRSGMVLGTYVAEVALDEPLEPAMQSLAEQLVLGALTRSEPEPLPGPPAVAAGPPRGLAPQTPAAAPIAPPEAADEQSAGAGPFGLGGTAGEPVSIRSGELEASEREGVRTLVFSDAVKAEQGDLRLYARRLVASYPEGDKQPSRLEAQGDVRVSQKGRQAFCAEAVYDRERQLIECRGEARIRYAGDEIAGEHMVFDLAQRGLLVEGGATVQLARSAESRTPAQGPLSASGRNASPLVARSQSLHAEQGPELQRIVLEGDVEVVESDVTLRSQRLELIYPRGARHPQRMEASGDVSLEQGPRGATCRRAVYREDPKGIDCLGGSLLDGKDRVAGDLIHFDLERQNVRVEGAAKLVLAPRPQAREGRRP